MRNDDDLTALAEAVGVLHDPSKIVRQSVLGGTLLASATIMAWASVTGTTWLIGVMA